MRGVLQSKGVNIVEEEEKADVIILNTCCVKTPTEQRILHHINNVKEKKLVIAGCLPSANKKIIEKFAPMASLVGVRSIGYIYDAVYSAFNNKKSIFFTPQEKSNLPVVKNGLIARVPIAEGCLGECTFCQTKLARGKLWSYEERKILDEVKFYIEKGFKEIRLTAQDTGVYGLDKGTKLPQLLKKIGNIRGDFRVRVGMMNPNSAYKILSELIEAYKDEKIYKFLHIPIQSGDDNVLRDMGREGGTKEFVEIIEKFRKNFPESVIATDIIVGFPSESERAFLNSMELIKEIQPDIVNISKFGARPKTPAYKLKPLPPSIIKQRSIKMSKLCREIGLEKNRRLIGKKFPVLLLERSGISMIGRANSYKSVIIKGDGISLGRFINVEIASATPYYLKGSL